MKNLTHSLFDKMSLIFLLFLGSIASPAQTYTMGKEEFMLWDDFIANYFDEFDMEIESAERNQQWAVVLESLEELHRQPININLAQRQDLLRIPFLTEAQTDSIISYRNKKRLFRSLGELQWLTNIPYTTRCQLSLFAFAGDTISTPPALGHRLFKGKHEIVSRMDIPLYKRAGDQDFTAEDMASHPSRYFLGSPISNTIRYRYNWRKDLSYGLTMQKDAGEPFAARGNYPYDYVAFYYYQKALSRRYAFWVGDYNVDFGEGLLLGHSFFYSPTQLIENSLPKRSRIRTHTSSDESHFFRGIAGAFKIKENGEISLFASYRKLDGKVKNDTLQSFKTDGLHRTLTELDNRKNVDNLTLGTRISFKKEHWHLAGNAYWSHYNKYIYPPLRTYNKYDLRGRSAAGASLDYAWKNSKWTFHGETAIDQKGHLATTNSVHLSLSGQSNIVLQQRSFSAKFVAPFGQTLQENSKVQNEHGLILGATLQPFSKFQLTSYIDGFIHPLPVFRADQASKGLEFSLQGKYTATSQFCLYLRYKMKTEELNVTGQKHLMQYVSCHRGRLAMQYQTKHFRTHIAADATLAAEQTKNNAFGWMLSSRNYLRLGKSFSFHAFAAVFFTDNYASRLYAYEPQLQYAASFPTFAYHGARAVGVAEWKFCKKGYAALRYGWLHYFNRKQISSGNALIDASSKNDLSLQVGFRI